MSYKAGAAGSVKCTWRGGDRARPPPSPPQQRHHGRRDEPHSSPAWREPQLIEPTDGHRPGLGHSAQYCRSTASLHPHKIPMNGGFRDAHLTEESVEKGPPPAHSVRSPELIWPPRPKHTQPHMVWIWLKGH